MWDICWFWSLTRTVLLKSYRKLYIGVVCHVNSECHYSFSLSVEIHYDRI